MICVAECLKRFISTQRNFLKQKRFESLSKKLVWESGFRPVWKFEFFNYFLYIYLNCFDVFILKLFKNLFLYISKKKYF